MEITELVAYKSITTKLPDPSTKIVLFKATDVEQLKKEIADETNYEHLFTDAHTKMWIKSKGEGSTGFKKHKYRTTLDVTKEKFYASTRDYKRRKDWDPRDMGREILDVYKADGYPVNVVEHFTKRGNIAVSHRDFVTINAEVREKQENGNETIYMMGRSIEHPQAIVKPGFVRSEILYLGMKIEADPKDPSKCIVWMVSAVDPKGWVPATLYNWILRYLPKEFEGAMTKACKMREDKKIADNDFLNFYEL